MKKFLLLYSLFVVPLALAEEPFNPVSAVKHPRVGICAGVNLGWQNPGIPEAIAAAGITWVREDFYWGKMEREKGKYEMPPEYQETIDKYNAAGLKILAIFNGGNKRYEPDIYDPAAYAKAAAWFARATKGKVQAIEILNEPSNFGFMKHYGGVWNGLEADGSVSPWVKKYVDLLNAAAPAIKAANPDVKVVGLGSAAPVNFRQLAMGIHESVDGITDHPYSMRLPAEYVPFASSEGILKRDGIATADARGTLASQHRMFVEQSQKYNGPKEVWLTEQGWTTYQESKAGDLFAGVTPEAQAKYLLRRLTQTLGLGTDATFIYSLRNTGKNPFEREDNFGIMDADLKPKPAYGAVQRFNHFMADYEPHHNFDVSVFPVSVRPDTHPIVWDGSKIETNGKILHYQFKNSEGKPLLVLWSSERPGGDLNPTMANVELLTEEPFLKAKVYDFFSGETKTVPVEHREGRIVLNKLSMPDSPVAISLE